MCSGIPLPSFLGSKKTIPYTESVINSYLQGKPYLKLPHSPLPTGDSGHHPLPFADFPTSPGHWRAGQGDSVWPSQLIYLQILNYGKLLIVST